MSAISPSIFACHRPSIHRCARSYAPRNRALCVPGGRKHRWTPERDHSEKVERCNETNMHATVTGSDVMSPFIPRCFLRSYRHLSSHSIRYINMSALLARIYTGTLILSGQRDLKCVDMLKSHCTTGILDIYFYSPDSANLFLDI